MPGVRRADPERIYLAKRAGFVARIADRVGHERAETLIAVLERGGSLGPQRDLVEFWNEAERRATGP